jgi:hypothetical protein
MATMVHSGAAASGPRRPRLAGLLSLVFHGGAVALLAALAGTHIVRSPPSKKVLVPVDVLRPAALPAPAPPPAPPPMHAAPAPQPGGATASAVAHARHEPVHRAQPVAPASLRSLADLTISYEDAANFAAPGPTKTDAAASSGRSGIGAGASTWRGDGIAKLDIPQPAATVSHARSPRPKRDYSNLRIPGASKFAGEIVKLQLTIGVNGKVRGVQLLHGVDSDLDRKTIALAGTFEYEPALDDEGIAIQGTSRWDIQIVEDEDGDLFETAREHRHR